MLAWPQNGAHVSKTREASGVSTACVPLSRRARRAHLRPLGIRVHLVVRAHAVGRGLLRRDQVAAGPVALPAGRPHAARAYLRVHVMQAVAVEAALHASAGVRFVRRLLAARYAQTWPNFATGLALGDSPSRPAARSRPESMLAKVFGRSTEQKPRKLLDLCFAPGEDEHGGAARRQRGFAEKWEME